MDAIIQKMLSVLYGSLNRTEKIQCNDDFKIVTAEHLNLN